MCGGAFLNEAAVDIVGGSGALRAAMMSGRFPNAIFSAGLWRSWTEGQAEE